MCIGLTLSTSGPNAGENTALGDVIIVRYADDIVMRFEQRADAAPKTFNFLGFAHICAKNQKNLRLLGRSQDYS